MNDHLLEVYINGIIQDALAVCFIHHDQSVHLWKETNEIRQQSMSCNGISSGVIHVFCDPR